MTIVPTIPAHIEGFKPLNGLTEEYMSLDAAAMGLVQSYTYLKDGAPVALFGIGEDNIFWLVPHEKLKSSPCFFARTAKKICDAVLADKGSFIACVHSWNIKAQALVKFLKFVKVSEVENFEVYRYG